MTKDQEKKVLQAIYDRLYNAITYQPEVGNNPFTESETFIHFSKNAAVDPESYKNPKTPSNPTGDLKTTEAFSRMVDQVSPLALEWENTGTKLSEQYSNIVEGANTDTQSDKDQVKMYNKAYNYLHTEDEDFGGYIDSKEYQKYQENQDHYEYAIQKYQEAYNKYLDALESDDEKVRSRADREWQVEAGSKENEIKKAYRNLSMGNAKKVEKALNILETTINEGVRTAIIRAKEAVAKDKKLKSDLGYADDWLISYPAPANWTDSNDLNFTNFNLSGGNTKTRSKATEQTSV